MENNRLFYARLILFLGIELLAIQLGMSLNRYSLLNGVGWVGMLSWFLIGGALAGSIGFGVLLSEIRPAPPEGRDPGFFWRFVPQLPWFWALLVSAIDSYFYFPRI
ncbi:hypothetical protein ACSYAY_09350 [Leptospirillum ferriphilum]|uniref:Uncharacterized protein n=4 Tax=Leptospirillum TaxID=179 RepID=A0A059XUW4_9BACT|nr:MULTISPECIES: hypothetical protein [Leptospirillum]EAY56840.1 MAG: hypothetical protein UBAL2_80490118 [Leptospirillum rubarum]EDZ38114.1 MAG: Hypothetical protein CGL2_11390051 [Leptospirillum sp. Group II '5-way CG']EIJ76761.1 MAG: Hypothetical protein C75L2_00380126 [Leptospirillum sp. Group II 'C75']AFS54050.1 hypothetical protein LFML04_1850 [Leptospirillum ferriphilum ML-04]AIA30860.1 hypothetical protein Y981_09240 [Leptospirillum ferriphilum YSK]